MDDPVKELANVVRLITEPHDAATLGENIDKYFTDDCHITHPFLNQPHFVHGKEYIKGIYKIFRICTINNKIEFHAVMFNEDKTQAAIELNEWLQLRFIPGGLFPRNLRFLIRVDLVQSKQDGKFRIHRQNDNFVSDLASSGILPLPITVAVITFWKAVLGFLAAVVGKFLLERGWLGA